MEGKDQAFHSFCRLISTDCLSLWKLKLLFLMRNINLKTPKLFLHRKKGLNRIACKLYPLGTYFTHTGYVFIGSSQRQNHKILDHLLESHNRSATQRKRKARHCFDFQYRDLMSWVTSRPLRGKSKRNANYFQEDNYTLK